MKKLTLAILFLLVVSICGAGMVASASDEVNIYLDGNLLPSDQPPLNIGDRVLVPIRVVAESLGCGVSWWPNEKMASITKNDVVLGIQINNPLISTFQTQTSIENVYEMDVPALLINDRTYVPIRMIAERFDIEVEWDGDVHLTRNSLDVPIFGAGSGMDLIPMTPVALLCDGKFEVVDGKITSPEYCDIKFLSNIFDLEYGLDGEYLIIKCDNGEMKLKNNDHLAFVNQKMEMMSAMTTCVDGEWILPMTDVTEFLGGTYSNDTANKIIKIQYKGRQYTIPYNEFEYSAINTEIEEALSGKKVWDQQNGKYGLIKESDGEVVIPYEYDFVYPFFNGVALVYKGDEWSRIDNEGNVRK